MKRLIKLLLLLFPIYICSHSLAQPTPFGLHIEAIKVPNFGGIQSFAFAQHNGKWLIIGGRLDGLHRRQPFAAFDEDGHNTNIIVIDPKAKKKWAAPLSSLPKRMQEQLSATNTAFYQNADQLYIVGGYGYSETEDDHTTYPNLTAIKVSATIDAVITNTPFAKYFRQIEDSALQVTGGRLLKMNGKYYLAGGQKFLGRYNPMGPDRGPGFIQEYTDQIKTFDIIDDGKTIKVKHYPAYKDQENLHRRDLNVVAQIMPDGKPGITMFSGVFQLIMDVPFLDVVDISPKGYKVNPHFSQYYNQYHTATLPIYAAKANQMHTLFFGGIAQFYDSAGTMVQHNDVPFVKTISRVTRNANGKMEEYRLPISMPDLLGASAEFIHLENIPTYENGVIKLDELTGDTTTVGYILGGIKSSAPNIFWDNDGTQSEASKAIYKVSIIKNPKQQDVFNPESVSKIKLRTYPLPYEHSFSLIYDIVKKTDVKIKMTDHNNKLLIDTLIENQLPGTYYVDKEYPNMEEGGHYILTIETAYETVSRKIIIPI